MNLCWVFITYIPERPRMSLPVPHLCLFSLQALWRLLVAMNFSVQEASYILTFVHSGVTPCWFDLLIPHSHHPGGFSMGFREHLLQTFVVCDPHVLYQQGMLHATWHWRATLNSRWEGRLLLQIQMFYYSLDSFTCIKDMWFIVIGNFY